MSELGQIGAEALEKRGISAETAVRLGVFTGKKIFNDAMEYVRVDPDPRGNILVFPFEDGAQIVNEKYRGPAKKDGGKQIWQSGGRRTFWNADIMDDPALARGDYPLIIVEGEIDGLTAIDCGFPFTVSVPDGAPEPPRDGKQLAQTDEPGTKFEFMWNNRERLRKIKRFVLAVDSDANGKHLASELVRRLSAARCYFVTYPEGCKDLNDVRMKHGPEAVTACLNGAKPYPVKDLHRLADFPDAPQIQTFATGWDTVDELFQLFTPCLMIATGIPSHGKSSFITNLCINASERHGWRWAVFSPEMPVVPHLRDKMRRIHMRSAIDRASKEMIAAADSFINNNFVFIEHMTAEDDLSLEWLIDRAEEAVMRYGVKGFVLDPWNEVEHAKRRDETMSEYISRGLRLIKRFQMRYDCMVIVIAHPTKDVATGGKARTPTVYDIDGSAAWFNKADIALIVERPDPNVDESMIYCGKIRFEGTGQKGSVRMQFDRETSRFELLDGRSNSTKHYGKM